METITEYCKSFQEKWNKIKELSNFDKDLFTSENEIAMRFFKRPLSSKFLHPENLGFNHFTSTYPLPAAFSKYKFITLEIFIDKSICNPQIHPEKIIKKVSFFYVVDTIIKDTQRNLIANLKIKSDNGELLAGDELNKITNYIRDPEKKFIMKLKSFEEFMFGDYPICTYDSIRSKVREYEPVTLYLMMKEKSKVNPNLTHYPPMIYIPTDDEVDYNNLFEKYQSLFTSKSIIFKFKPIPELQQFYLNDRSYDRREKLTKICESGECDYPFSINIKGIFNLLSLKKHLENKEYHDGDSDLPYFNRIPSKEIKNIEKKNILQV